MFFFSADDVASLLHFFAAGSSSLLELPELSSSLSLSPLSVRGSINCFFFFFIAAKKTSVSQFRNCKKMKVAFVPYHLDSSPASFSSSSLRRLSLPASLSSATASLITASTTSLHRS